MSKTYIIGHQKPDTDSAVAALALAELFQHLPCAGYENPVAVVADPLNPETSYLFEKFGVTPPQQISAKDIQPENKIVLVDHNEKSQRLPGLNPEQIVEIVDHHKVNLNLSKPIFLNFKAWGSATTIVYFMMKQYGSTPYQPNKKLAGLMLSAILSDTVGYKSATTTDHDKKLGAELATIAEIENVEALALEIFKAKSNLDDLSDKELVKNDYKKYQFAQSVLIGQIETVEQAKLLKERKQGLLEAMKQVKAEEQVDLIFLAITDVLQINTKLLLADGASAEIVEQAFGTKTEKGSADIGPKMSRKREIAPAIEKILKK
ncbi:MAG: manganese-dependent inorganic pyrophosphatase [Patescibacteria group bacterium]|nr:manganese-dependent inorganic pyrophosphatase [Patescibacteria group bacterium]